LFEFLEKRKIWMVYIPLTIYWLILFTATSIPVERLPSLGLTDKLNHFIAYFVLAFLLKLTLIFQRKSRFLFEKAPYVTGIICMLYGAFDELHQMFIPGRFAETLDWLADLSGAMVGIVTIYFLIYKFNYKLEFN